MEPYLIAIICVAGAILLFGVALFVFALFIKRAAFGSRCDKNPLLRYFTGADFGLSEEIYEIASVGKTCRIRAALYKKGEPSRDALVIFCHGMGPGHIAYTTEIAYFCSLGYAVLAPDYEGCNLSDGKSIKSLKSGAVAAEAAVKFARRELKAEKVYLVGHSWGAYSALVASSQVKADKVVAMSAPDKPTKVIYSALSSRTNKFLAKLLYPFVSMVCGGKSSAACAEKSGAPVLLVHGENDEDVPRGNAAFYKAEGENIKKLLVKDRAHNPYNTVAAEARLKELTGNLRRVGSGDVPKEYFENFDFSAATEEDVAVMGEISRFLSGN